MDNFGYIYTFWDKKLKRYIYVGQTDDFKRRMGQHLQESKKDNPLQLIEIEIMEYGINNYNISKIEFPLSELNNQEMYFIRYFQTREYYGGCNLTDGGDGIRGYKFSEESKRKMSKPEFEQSLGDLNPELSKQWHPTKNGKLTPFNVTYGSNKKVWWICEKGHIWKATIADRNNGKNCPYCSGRFATKENNLGTINPELSKQWHPTKNGKLTPFDVTPNSNKKAWWICQKGHEWEAGIAHRNNGSNCPFCCNQKVCIDNCLATKNPELSKQWHPTKNGNLTPFDICPNSNKKVWWICKICGYEWKSVIASRNKGNNCPYCQKEKQKNEGNPNAKCYKLTSPNNEIFIIKGTLEKFCKENNLCYGMIKRLLYKNYKNDNYKEWKIEYFNK